MKLFNKLGPGLLYAGAAIGVSHLVQSTKAGANYGLTLIIVVLLANILKYPFFEFGVRYASVTGKSLLCGYQKLGTWAVWLFIIVTVSTMFTVIGAVTLVTVGLLEHIFQLGFSNTLWATLLLSFCTIILLIGKYKLLDSLIKWIILLLSITLIITLVAAFGSENKLFSFGDFSLTNKTDMFFLIALVGWMPAPFDIAVWNSIWTTEKHKSSPRSLKEALFDFKIGYWGTTILAVLFLSLGSIMLFDSGHELSSNGKTFAQQVLDLFTSNIGQWAFPVIAIATVTTMFSTTLTCLDAFPRSLAKVSFKKRIKNEQKKYFILLLVLGIGGIITIHYLGKSMGQMITIATAISFISAPVLAIMNHLSIFNEKFPIKHKPTTGLKILSIVGIIFLVGFTFYYLYALIYLK